MARVTEIFRVDSPIASIVVPAHNEERAIKRLLQALTDEGPPDLFDIVVVANGCSDSTAAQARSLSADIRVIEIEIPSKSAALRAGDSVARFFPRVYVDADVMIRSAAIRMMILTLCEGPTLACGPRRTIDRTGVSALVRSYYNVWERLPQVRQGLFGRGVVAVSQAGHERISHLPALMSDDLAMSEAFVDAERRIVETADVIIRPPKTLRDLLRRRIRVVTGNFELDATPLSRRRARTTIGTLFAVVRAEPKLLPHLVVFLAVTVIARFGARRRIRTGDFHSWLRDESSRVD